jgi:hypothetical protein
MGVDEAGQQRAILQPQQSVIIQLVGARQPAYAPSCIAHQRQPAKKTPASVKQIGQPRDLPPVVLPGPSIFQVLKHFLDSTELVESLSKRELLAII